MRNQEILNRFFLAKKDLVIQFVKFGLVGISNTVISYSVEMLGYYVFFKNAGWPEPVKVFGVTALAFVISVTNSYYWNEKYVFGDKKNKTLRQHLKTYTKTVACYGVTGLVLAPCFKLCLGMFKVPYWAASLASLCLTIPLNFLLNKLWAFSRHDKKSKMENP